jgi:hypothetical protein
MSDEQRHRIARAARERALAQHTAAQRAVEMEQMLHAASRPEGAMVNVGYHPSGR